MKIKKRPLKRYSIKLAMFKMDDTIDAFYAVDQFLKIIIEDVINDNEMINVWKSEDDLQGWLYDQLDYYKAKSSKDVLKFLKENNLDTEDYLEMCESLENEYDDCESLEYEYDDISPYNMAESFNDYMRCFIKYEIKNLYYHSTEYSDYEYQNI